MKADKWDGGWNPYIAGALSGLVIILSVVLSGNYFGTSTSFVQVLGIIEKLLAPERVAQSEYFTTVVNPVLSWQMLFVAGIFMGGMIAALIYGDFKWKLVPDLWIARLGKTGGKRAAYAFSGGIIAMLGARLAGGCPSGQMSSLIVLSLSGLAAMVMFFIVGIVTARILYSGGER